VGPDAYTPVPEQRHEAFGARLVVARIQVEVRRGRGGGLLQRVAPVAAGRAVVEQRGDRRQERAEHRRGGEQAAQRGGFDVGPLRHAPCRAAGGEREQGDRQQAEKEPGPVHRRCRRARRHRRRRGAVADMEVGEVLRRAVEVELARERHVRLGARALRVVDVVERDVEADPSLRVRPQRIEVPERDAHLDRVPARAAAMRQLDPAQPAVGIRGVRPARHDPPALADVKRHQEELEVVVGEAGVVLLALAVGVEEDLDGVARPPGAAARVQRGIVRYLEREVEMLGHQQRAHLSRKVFRPAPGLAVPGVDVVLAVDDHGRQRLAPDLLAQVTVDARRRSAADGLTLHHGPGGRLCGGHACQQENYAKAPHLELSIPRKTR
jgi:hypothetical protein